MREVLGIARGAESRRVTADVKKVALPADRVREIVLAALNAKA